MEHDIKADEHFKHAESHVKAGRHREAWNHLGQAQQSAAKHAHEMASNGNISQAKAYRKMITSRVAHISGKINKAKEDVSDILKQAKKMVDGGDVKGALEMLKSVANEIKGAIVECPECGTDAALMKDATQESGECGGCGAVWGKKRIHSPLLKFPEGERMIDPENKDNKLTKKEVISALWELYRQGDKDVDAYDVNYFEATGWLKKSLAEKLGLPIPGVKEATELKKDEENTEIKKDIQPLPEDVAAPRDFLSKGEILDVLLNMIQKGEESQYVNRHTVAKFEATSEIDDGIMAMVYKKVGRNWFDLRKKLDKSGPSMLASSEDGPPKDVEEKIESKEQKDIWKKKKKAQMKKEKGKSDFWDDKKEHAHQKRGALKPIVIKKKDLNKAGLKVHEIVMDPQQAADNHPSAMMADAHKKAVADAKKQNKKIHISYSHTPWGKVVHNMKVHEEQEVKKEQPHDEKPAKPRKAKFNNRAAPSKIGIKVKQYGNKYHGGGDPGISDGDD